MACAAWTATLGLTPFAYVLWVLGSAAPASTAGLSLQFTLGAILVAAVVELARWHRARRLGEVVAAVETDRPAAVVLTEPTQSIAGASAHTRHGTGLDPTLSVAAALLDAPLALALLLFLWFVHPFLPLAALGGGLLLQAISGVQWKSSAAVPNEDIQRAATAENAARQCFEQAASWRALGMQDALTQRWVVLQQHAAHHQQAFLREMIASETVVRALLRLLGLVMLGLSGLWLIQTSTVSAAELLVTSLLGAQALMPLLTLIIHAPAAAKAHQPRRRLNSTPSDQAPAQPQTVSSRPSGSLVVERLLLFSQPNLLVSERDPSSALDFQLPPGEMLGILGPSGSGKSTLARVLAGLQPPAFGTVTLGGVPLGDWARQARQSCIGYLPQQREAYAGSLAEFVARCAHPDPSMVNRALNDAGLFFWVQSLPERDQTLLDQGGDWLSASWYRRLGLARALYGRPPLLVLDEPTTDLDREGERALERVLAECKARGCRVVVVSRRPSVLRLADRLLVLSEGRSVANGLKGDVLAQCLPCLQVSLADADGLAEANPNAVRSSMESVLP